jgi:glycosyltransferase involved in cell wall biosynthesis
MQPLVSILIPAYNAGAWLSDTIKSAQAQTWPNKEIIIVDDGSKDNTLSIARSFASSNLHVFTQTNQGASAARNKALSHSRGDYLQWLDADDLLGPDKIASQMAVIGQGIRQRTLLSGSWGRFIYRASKADFSPTPLWHDLSPIEWLSRKMEQNLHMQPATWLVSRELTEAAGPWDTRLSFDDDGEYFCRVLLASNGVKFVPEARVFYRISGPGCLSYIGRSNKKLESQFLSMQAHVRCLRSLGDTERVRKACLTYLQNWIIYFHPERLDLMQRLDEIAVSLGGKLEVPRLSWKYALIDKIFGRVTAKKAQINYNKFKSYLVSSCDKAMFYFEKPGLPS